MWVWGRQRRPKWDEHLRPDAIGNVVPVWLEVGLLGHGSRGRNKNGQKRAKSSVATMKTISRK
jgi:hypothetical protein